MCGRERFSGKVVLLTGAGSPNGIGYAAAKIFASEGAKLAIVSTTDRIEARAKELQELTGGEVAGFVCDLKDWKQTQEMVKHVFDHFGRIDILINNAGMATVNSAEIFKKVADLSEEEWKFSIDLNLNTNFNCTQAVLPYMIKAKYGRIVSTSSVTGPLVSNPGEAPYGAAKAAITGLMRGLAIEVACEGITVNCVAPGWIKTGSSTESEIAAGLNTPMRRPGRPEEVGNVMAFLASDDASYVNGQIIVVDGGNIIQEYKGPSELYY